MTSRTEALPSIAKPDELALTLAAIDAAWRDAYGAEESSVSPTAARNRVTMLAKGLKCAEENFRVTNQAYCKLDLETRDLRAASSAEREPYLHPILAAQRGTPGYEAEKAALSSTRRAPLAAWGDDVALRGPDAPKDDGKIKHLIEYLLTVYERFGNTVVTVDLLWGTSALHKLSEERQRIAELEARVSATEPLELVGAVRAWVYARATKDQAGLLTAEWNLNEAFRKEVGLDSAPADGGSANGR